MLQEGILDGALHRADDYTNLTMEEEMTVHWEVNSVTQGLGSLFLNGVKITDGGSSGSRSVPKGTEVLIVNLSVRFTDP
jgi:hypothetical protein